MADQPTTIDLLSFQKNMEIYKNKIEFLSLIENYTYTPVLEDVFSDVKSMNTSSFFYGEKTEILQLVPQVAPGGKPIPVGKRQVSAREISPYLVSLSIDYTVEKLIEDMKLLGIVSNTNNAVSDAQVYRNALEVFLMIKREVVVNNAHQFIGTGKIPIEVVGGKGKQKTVFQLDYTEGGTKPIASYNYDTAVDGLKLHNWADSATTESMIEDDLLGMKKVRYKMSKHTYFINREIVVYVSSAAFAAAKDKITHESKIIAKDGDDLMVGTFRLKDEQLPYKKPTWTASGGIEYTDDADAIGAREVVMIDVRKGIHKIREMKYNNIDNIGKATTPYTLTTEKLAHKKGIQLEFNSAPLIFGKTEAIVKGQVVPA